MSKLTNAEKEKLDNTCGNLRITKLGTHVKGLEDFVNEGTLRTQANTVVPAINELYSMIADRDCEGVQIPPPGFFTLWGNDADGKLYCYYNDQNNPPLFRHIEEPGELEGTLYLYIADPDGPNSYEMEIGHYIAVRHLDNYYTKSQSDTRFGVTVEKQASADSGYAATYVVKQNNAQKGVKINIPKDFLVKSASIKTCSTANVPVQGYQVGDKYIDWVINAKDSSATDEHLYLLVSELVDAYTAGTGLTLSGTTFNHSNSITAQTSNVFKKFKYDAQGHITGTANVVKSDLTGLGVEDASNKVNSLSSASTNTQYPSAKAVYDLIGDINNYITS